MSSGFEIVIHMRSKDGIINQTLHFPNVGDLVIRKDQLFQESRPSFMDILHNSLGRTPLGTAHSFEFVSVKGEDGVEYRLYDNNVAEPDLDVFLATFPRAERVNMIEKYLAAMNEEIEAFVQKYGAAGIREWLDYHHPDPQTGENDMEDGESEEESESLCCCGVNCRH